MCKKCQNKIGSMENLNLGSIDATAIAAFTLGGGAARALDGVVKNFGFIKDETDEEKQKNNKLYVSGVKAAAGAAIAYYGTSTFVKCFGVGMAIVSTVDVISTLVPNIAGGLYGIGETGSGNSDDWGYGEMAGVGRAGTRYGEAVGALPTTA